MRKQTTLPRPARGGSRKVKAGHKPPLKEQLAAATAYIRDLEAELNETISQRKNAYDLIAILLAEVLE